MGNIKSFCCKDTASEIDDREERTRILNGNSASCEDLYNNSTTSAFSHQDRLSYGSISNVNGSKSMEQSALDKIYQKMASNVIDVAPGESMVIQQAEFVERQKAYQTKLNQIKTPLSLKSRHRSSKPQNNHSDAISPNITSNGPVQNASLTNDNMMGNNLTSLINTTISTTGESSQVFSKGQERRGVEYEPISTEEIQLINEISLKSAQAVKGMKINSREQVVTQFRP